MVPAAISGSVLLCFMLLLLAWLRLAEQRRTKQQQSQNIRPVRHEQPLERKRGPAGIRTVS
jgi:ABC-type Fe3+ transport system permease subunit